MLLLTVGAAAGCGAAPGTGGPASAVTASPTSPAPAAAAVMRPVQQPQAVAFAEAQLRAFLSVWVSQGYRPAAARFLTPEYQAGASEPGVPLRAGRVTSVRLTEWTSSDRFQVQAELQLSFAGEHGAWTNGSNTRFVTVTRISPDNEYRLSLATSP